MAVHVKADDAEQQAELRELYPTPVWERDGNACASRHSRRVGNGNPFGTWVCSREAGHDGRHVAHVGHADNRVYKRGDIVGYWMPEEQRS